LAKRLTGYSLKSVAEHFGRDPVAISQGVGKLESRLREDENLGRRITELAEYLVLTAREPFTSYIIDDFVKIRFYAVFIIPAKAGIHFNQAVLGSRLRGSDGFADFLRNHHT
jgi:hypothetical protein